MTSIIWLQEWYVRQCNESWEHQYGVIIETLDNPGWLVKIDLTGTSMQDVSLEDIRRGEANGGGLMGDQDWLNCKREGDQFIGAGGPMSLLPICDAFKSWVESSTAQQ